MVADSNFTGMRSEQKKSGSDTGNTAETVDKLFEYFRESGRYERLLKIAESEPPRVRAMLGAIGQQLGHPESRLSALRASLNPLSRFDFGNLSVLEHAQAWQAKERKRP
jgi:hypothetical protein